MANKKISTDNTKKNVKGQKESIISEELIDAICLLRKQPGNNEKKIAEKLGLSVDTLYTWMNRGKEDRRIGANSLYAALHARFRATSSIVLEECEDALRGLALGLYEKEETSTMKDAVGNVTQTVTKKTKGIPDKDALKFTLSNLNMKKWGKGEDEGAKVIVSPVPLDPKQVIAYARALEGKDKK